MPKIGAHYSSERLSENSYRKKLARAPAWQELLRGTWPPCIFGGVTSYREGGRGNCTRRQWWQGTGTAERTLTSSIDSAAQIASRSPRNWLTKRINFVES